jgi:hypothetical protein
MNLLAFNFPRYQHQAQSNSTVAPSSVAIAPSPIQPQTGRGRAVPSEPRLGQSVEPIAASTL